MAISIFPTLKVVIKLNVYIKNNWTTSIRSESCGLCEGEDWITGYWQEIDTR